MAIARAARRLGVTFETGRPVTAIRIERGAVRGVDTPAGPLVAPRVVVAAGPWVERVAGAVGLAVDTVPLRHQHWTTAPMSAVPADLPVVRVPDASVYIRPEVGGLMLGGFEAHPKAFPMADLPPTFEIEHTEKDLGVLEELAGGLTRAFPDLAGAPVLKGCAGLPTFTPDGNYLLGRVPTVGGLFVAAGCNAIGIAGSLLIGEWLSEMVLEGATRDDTKSQALDRFGPRYGDRRRLRDDCESVYGNFYSLDRGAF
jgi:4-methylaminobutanoate oxidase (formaldehyde-forming)